MRTTITTSVDAELKAKAMPIIQNKLNSSIGKILDKAFEKVIVEDSQLNKTSKEEK